MMARLTILFVAGAALAGAAFLRNDLHSVRRDLGLAPRWVERTGGSAAEDLGARWVVLSSAALGVLRPLAIDFLWLRAAFLQADGSFFEAEALSRLITRLEPRLPDVWAFVAHNLAYNIPPSFPPRERYTWVLRGLRLLRDEGLVFNPRSAAIHFQLAFTYRHKIGLDLDEAGRFYRAELADTFEAGNGEPPADQALLEAWRLEPDRVKRLEAKYGAVLDFRVAESHALYWAERGLELAGPDVERWRMNLLRGEVEGACWQLFNGGRPIKAPGGILRAFLPDLRFAGAVEELLDARAGRGAPDSDELRAEFWRRRVLYVFLFEGAEPARASLARAEAFLRTGGAALEDILAASILAAGGERPPLEVISGLLDASVLLEIVGESSLSTGFRALANLRYESLGEEAGGRIEGPFEALFRAAVLRRAAAWRADARTRSLLERSRLLTEVLELAGPEPKVSLPPPGDLLFELEVLDPLHPDNAPSAPLSPGREAIPPR
ncbi:MAG TPA: hypothetical protein VMT52_00495 [Planctomycetota bacterium]|nr:hypothetical protein [Planctomycetota bacterium]